MSLKDISVDELVIEAYVPSNRSYLGNDSKLFDKLTLEQQVRVTPYKSCQTCIEKLTYIHNAGQMPGAKSPKPWKGRLASGIGDCPLFLRDWQHLQKRVWVICGLERPLAHNTYQALHHLPVSFAMHKVRDSLKACYTIESTNGERKISGLSCKYGDDEHRRDDACHEYRCQKVIQGRHGGG